MIENGLEIKQAIRKLGYTLKEFAEAAEIDVNYLYNTINGYQEYREVLSALEKYGIKYVRKQRKRVA
ncbi:MAG TPA: hypothetical protein PK079_23965 [Leptospiraceae bacterium]|nr:hypothetical protein [Leptospiraceae bacterium]HMW08558.1 hypothetical protein [Leptospiraceae bacterium]HMZ66499.1 hypothetical protein [Leptospiraceae bacterium]HNA10041.1 hypothetical protein [Leptospiraceae bacterium]HNC00438.1 hypothetical protein [Leptospiraceae bacterium]